ncbi:MOSC domain-containing protein [Paenibacillus donghaensis]|uniref:Sulfurase n=1 Tax=Paenibacillus donghaensis TaxID=414771 RepID=A0A2Z2KH04_9BACL|nr:MOSC N-terminal beta barrel domain-containing protein [Paenibacillus donghaensis]ASA22450.1 sulfurase [Paenibacillus donghaensis]
MQETVGTIREINRYPVKSFAGEGLEVCEVEAYGMLGDRFCAFYDESKTGWKRYVTARNIPNMLSYQAQFRDGEIRVTSADGRTFGWDKELLAEIQSQTSTDVSMSGIKATHPEHPQLLSVDGASILLITDASLAKLQDMWGKSLDQRRFRGNFVVALNDESLDEGNWIGKQLCIGDVQLRVDSYCNRCTVITMDPDTLERDPSLLKKVNTEFGLHFGVYASVVTTGKISVGDKVELVESE